MQHLSAQTIWNRQHAASLWCLKALSLVRPICAYFCNMCAETWAYRGTSYLAHLGHSLNDKVMSFGGNTVMVEGGISLTGKTRLVTTGGNINPECCPDEILQPVAVPYLQSLGLNTDHHRAGFIRDDLENLGVERTEWFVSSPDVSFIEQL